MPSYKKSVQNGDKLLYGGGAGGVAAWQGVGVGYGTGTVTTC